MPLKEGSARIKENSYCLEVCEDKKRGKNAGTL